MLYQWMMQSFTQYVAFVVHPDPCMCTQSVPLHGIVVLRGVYIVSVLLIISAFHTCKLACLLKCVTPKFVHRACSHSFSDTVQN